MKPGTLVFSWGNPSRGDDALGPLFAEAIEALRLPGVECLTDFQLQVEHALDLAGRRRVLFVDASMEAAAPFSVAPLLPRRDASFTTHAMTPAAILQVYADTQAGEPPPAWLLGIRGERWELGQAISPAARNNLAAAIEWTRTWLAGDAAGLRGAGEDCPSDRRERVPQPDGTKPRRVSGGSSAPPPA
ncbi:hydrogenase maturation protease [Thauera sinica]|uniref:Hydrogenase maturation protease n=1 Tax=Thauera sinica TaxID=2665146 RepID=A0ABW1AS37_9RHOO|nr:hydrogenase maturation protease [Thauera sp. K11]ATE62183.1 Ni/Fe hydrogenase [Thauera sp. K11]